MESSDPPAGKREEGPNHVIKLLIVGPNGSMGRALVKFAATNRDIDLVAGVGPKGRDYIGQDLGLLVGLGHPIGVPVSDSLELTIDACDVVLECTRPDVSMSVLKTCLQHRKAFVTGTTGFSEEQAAKIERASDTIPVLRASNGSRIVHLLYNLIHTVTQAVGEEADIDVIEMHGRTKPDAPSGTALEIGEIITGAMRRELKEVAVLGREGLSRRTSDAIQFSSVRSGGITSTHQIIFGFQNERLELTHRAYNTDAFAEGLIEAALFVGGKEQGCFTLDDTL